MLVVITDSNLPSRDAEERVLQAAGFDVKRADCRTETDVVDAAQDADALIVQWAPITAGVLGQLDRCRLVSRLGIGLDMIDLDAATSMGIAVSNTPDYCIEEVAAHTIALALSISRGIPSLEASLRRSDWAVAPNAPVVTRPSSAVFAVLGFGRIGSRVARIATSLGFRVVVHDPAVPDDEIEAQGFTPVDLRTALEQGQIISLHTPLTDETYHLIDGEALELMGSESFLINTSRGELIDAVALSSALERGIVAGAALDVFEVEPLPNDSPLRHAPNAIVTPHAAWYSKQALEELPRQAAENVVAFFSANLPAPSIVNPSYASVPRPSVAFTAETRP